MTSYRRVWSVVVFGLIWMCLASSGLNQRTSAGFDQKQYCSGDFEGCPPEGDGGDAIQNILKNRDIAPKEYMPISIEQILATKRDMALAMGKKHRANWDKDALEEVAVIECSGWVTEGYAVAVKQQGVESCNCHDKTRRDYHLWLGPKSESTEGESLIAEVSPRMLRKHPGWKLQVLRQLAKGNARLRISGWGMWDGEHPDLIGKTRATLIEIHPIMKIEVQNGGKWLEL